MQVLVLAVLALASVVAARRHDYTNPKHFAEYLRELEASHEFRGFTDNQKVLYAELILAAEDGPTHLKAFMHREGKLLEIFRMLDLLDKEDRIHLDGYISAHLHTPQPNPDRRETSPVDLAAWMKELHLMNKVLEHLHAADAKIFMQLMYAVEHDTLSEYLAEVSYAQILTMLSKMGKREHEVDQMLILHLKNEAAKLMTTPQTNP